MASSSTQVGFLAPVLIFVLIIAIGYAIVSVIRRFIKASWLQGVVHFFGAIKTLLGAISLTAGVVLVVYGFLEYNEQRNTVQGKITNALSDKPDNTPIFIVVGGACLIIIGLTLLLLKTQENKVVQYVGVQKDVPVREAAATLEIATGAKQVFCRSCGSKGTIDSQFCSQCGEKLM